MVEQSNYVKVENGQTSHNHLYLLTIKVCVCMQIIENSAKWWLKQILHSIFLF